MTDQAFQLSSVPAHLRIPKYRLHKPKGLAVVTLRGRDHYLGKFNSPESHEQYQAVIAEFIASRGVTAEERASITVAALILHYWRYAQESYSRETLAGSIKPALSRLRKLFGSAGVSDFGPLKLKAFRQSLLDESGDKGEHLSRPYINRLVRQVRSLFKWGVGEELVPPGIYHGLLAVEGIKYGRTKAPEPEPVTPVADAMIDATVPHLCSVVGDMVRLQRLTGMRPGEVCRMTTGELDTNGAVWTYLLRRHKTAHHGKRRLVPIGPRAQEILRKYLPDLPDITVASVRDVGPLLSDTINQVRKGLLDPRIANTVGYLSGVLIRAFEVGDIEERIARLEATLRSKPDPEPSPFDHVITAPNRKEMPDVSNHKA